MGNAKSKNKNSTKIEKEISRNLTQSSLKVTTTTVQAKTIPTILYGKEDNNINVGGTTSTTTTATTTVGGPLSLEVRNLNTTTTKANSNKAVKDPQQKLQQHTKPKQRQQKAADNSAVSEVAEQQRIKQASSLWSLGSLNWNLSFSGRNSFKQRQKSSRKSFSTLQYQRKRSKTQWHKPLTNAIFSSHFKETSRNEEFHIDQLVAKGAFGVVFKVIDKKSIKEQQQQQQQQQQHLQQHQQENQQLFTDNLKTPTPPTVYALKVLKKSKIISENSLQQIKDEVDIQKVCGHHPFIVKQFDLWQNRYNLHILSEYLPNGELFSTIKTFSLNLIRLYLAEIALALDFLHNAGIIYRDAKPENILLTQDYHLKLIDFGLSKWLKLGLTTKTMCGTFQYMVFDLTMEGRQVDEAVASIFHTVLFHRCLGKYMYTGDAQYSIGTVGYTDVDCDFIDFTYVCCTSDSLQRTVKRAINVFSEKLRSNESCGSGQISLEFFQKKKSRWPFTPECIPWEVWTIHLDLIKHENEDERQMCRENVADLLTEKVIYITEIMNRHDYVPKTPSQSELDLIFDTTYPDVQPYLFKFVSSTSDTAAPSMGNAVKKIIKETLAL